MPISEKQRQILAFPYTHYDALIADGAIRSGKTVFMTIAFVDWAMREFDGQRFGVCGKTVSSAMENIIVPYIGLKYAHERYRIKFNRSQKMMMIQSGSRTNFFEIFGGKDESSYMLIQGRTLAGVLFDEVVLQAESFVKQALARCSVEGSKVWFNCNPESPQHWFYRDWICQPEKHNAIRIQFELKDNPSLSAKKLKWYESNYDGVFYQRYILGQWVLAEGLVYSNFGEENITDYIPESGEYYISIDYGTMNPFSAGLWCIRGKKAVRVTEYYYNGRERKEQKTDSEYADAIDELVKKIPENSELAEIVVDPSAASFVTELRQRGYNVRKAKNDVLDGIRLVSKMLKNGNIKIHRSCEDCITEFGLYRWDDKAAEDTVIKENDHAMDDTRYFCSTIMKDRVSEEEYTPIIWGMMQ